MKSSVSFRTIMLGQLFSLLLLAPLHAQRITDGLIALYDFTEGQGNIVIDRGPEFGAPGDPIDR